MVKYAPRPYQKRMIDMFIDNKKSGAFAGMGLGKTSAALTAIDDLMYDQFEVMKVLVVAPLRVAMIAWPEEIKKWGHTSRMTYSFIYGPEASERLEDNSQIHLLSYSTLPWLVEYLRKNKYFPNNYDMVVFDESTFIKSVSSQRWLICRALFDDVPRKIILTGTPTPNGIIDVWGQVYMLDDGKALGRSKSDFLRTYFTKGRYKHSPMVGATDKITKKISHMVVSLKTEDYLQLPELIDIPMSGEFDDKSRELYNEMEEELFLTIGDKEITAQGIASVGMKLRQLCQGFLIDDESEIIGINSVKIKMLREIVDLNPDENILVAVQFRHEMDMIKEEFGSDTPCIYSKTSNKDDAKNIRKWNAGKIKLLAAHPASIAHGLNLQTGGRLLVWLAMTWNLEHYEQLVARLHRSGQTKPVMCYRLNIRDTIDLVINEAIKRKMTDQNNVMKLIKEYRHERSLH